MLRNKGHTALNSLNKVPKFNSDSVRQKISTEIRSAVENITWNWSLESNPSFLH